MRDPYVYLIGPSSANVVSAYVRGQGVQTQQQIGAHGIWAATVPFIPALDSEELVRGGSSRIGKIVGRHFRFLYDLARVEEHRATYELRFIAHPPTGLQETGRVEIVFFGKVFHPKRSQVPAIAYLLWRKFLSNFPLEDPFNYPISPVTDAAKFRQLYEPIPFEQLNSEHGGCITEIRRHEEDPIEIPGTPQAKPKEYIIHPFVPTLDYSAMGRLFETLAIQKERCFASITIRPVALHDLEIHAFNEMAGRLRQMAESSGNSELEIKHSEYRRTRAEMGSKIYATLMREREFLMQVKVQVVGLPHAPRDLVEALGSEMMNNGRNPFPTKWVQSTPDNADDFETAKRNLMLIEQDDWGPTVASPELRRLRSIADVYQAAGAFRLPIPPESGFMPGILVKSEPFVAPQDHLEIGDMNRIQGAEIHLGQIHHRGSPTGQQLSVPAHSLTRHGLIAGSTGSGKSTTISSILLQLRQQKPPVPFLVLYPLDKPDYRDLARTKLLRDDLLIFTVGDERVASFRFNPFAVPDGVLIKTHLSRLMRAFSAAFELFPPLPMIYREALRLVYRQKGWDILTDIGQSGRTYPILSDFYQAIKTVTDKLKYGGEVKDTVRQASVIRIADLLENAGHVLNVKESPSFDELLKYPVVMELGRIGSQEDISLIMGFLLMLLVETLEKRRSSVPHITVVEEAHRLMSRSSRTGENVAASAAEDFANILAEVRGHNAGLLIAEQIPSQLVCSAIGNTFLKVMHWLEDRESFDLFADIMNLSEQQRAYARRLKPGEAIVRSRLGRPVHIQVQQPASKDDESVTLDDDWLRTMMVNRLQKVGIALPKPAAPILRDFSDIDTSEPGRLEVAERIFIAPLRIHCAFCRPLLQQGTCPYRKTVADLYQQEVGRELAARTYDILKHRQLEPEEIQLIAIQSATLARSKEEQEIGYCFLAHLNDQIFSGDFSDAEQRNAGLSLRSFPWSE